MRERIFTRDYVKKDGEIAYPRGTRLTLRSLTEWDKWFPGFRKFTRAVDEVIDEAAYHEESTR